MAWHVNAEWYIPGEVPDSFVSPVPGGTNKGRSFNIVDETNRLNWKFVEFPAPVDKLMKCRGHFQIYYQEATLLVISLLSFILLSSLTTRLVDRVKNNLIEVLTFPFTSKVKFTILLLP